MSGSNASVSTSMICAVRRSSALVVIARPYGPAGAAGSLAVVRLATWNVNSVRSRIHRVEAFLQRHDVDVLALQETKARDDQWPTLGLSSLGYEVASYGTNQWNGVAIVSRLGLEDVQLGFEGMPTY